MRRVGELDETTLEHPALLEAAVTEAFHEAAAENFPPQVLIPSSTRHGPRDMGRDAARRKRKYYKKYTRVFDVEITPQIADSLKTRRRCRSRHSYPACDDACPGARPSLPGDVRHDLSPCRAARAGRRRPRQGHAARAPACSTR